MKKDNQETLDLLVCILWFLAYGLYLLIRGLWSVFARPDKEEPLPPTPDKDADEEEKSRDARKANAFFLLM